MFTFTQNVYAVCGNNFHDMHYIKIKWDYYLRQHFSQYHLVYLSVKFNTFSIIVQIIFYLSHIFFSIFIVRFLLKSFSSSYASFIRSSAVFSLQLMHYHSQFFSCVCEYFSWSKEFFFSHRFTRLSEKKEVTEKFPFAISESKIIWFERIYNLIIKLWWTIFA